MAPPAGGSTSASRAASSRLRPPAPSSSAPSSSSSASGVTTSARFSSMPTSTTAPTTLPLELPEPPPPLPAMPQIHSEQTTSPDPVLIAQRLLSLAQSYLSLCSSSGPTDFPDWDIDLCSATFYATFALCLDPTSIRARRLLCRCARLGGFHIVLPFSPSGSAGSSNVSATKLNSFEHNDAAGAQSCIHILQQGSKSTFDDPGSAKEYREACRTLGRNADALQAGDVLGAKTLGKRKALDRDQASNELENVELVSKQLRYQVQLKVDEAFEASRRHQLGQAKSGFQKALEKDPFNWRAWAGLCDLGYGEQTSSQFFNVNVIDKLYKGLEEEIRTPYLEAEATFKSSLQPISTELEQKDDTTMARKVSEDGSNKKLKVSTEHPSTTAPQANTTAASASESASQRRPIHKMTISAPTTAASTVTATRLHPASRALLTAQTNTTQVNLTNKEDDMKDGVKTASIPPSRFGRAGVTRATAIAPTSAAASAQNRQLRSTATRGPVSGVSSRQTAGRAGATSQAGSVSSISSASSASSATSVTSRTTASTARTAMSSRRANSTATTPASSQSTTRGANGKPMSSSTLRNVTTATGKTATATRSTASSLGRPASAMSKASNNSVSTTRSNGTATGRAAQIAQQAAAQREAAAAAAEVARLRADKLVQLREECVHKLGKLAQLHAADLYIIALLRHLGEAYRLLRICEGQKAADVLNQPILATLLSDVKRSLPAVQGEANEVGTNGQPATHALTSRFVDETALYLDPYIRNTLPYQALLARSYAECSNYASAEKHFAHLHSLNPCAVAHMDIYSLVLFHLTREVTLSSLAQHLSSVAPGSGATQIVIGNAFSLQKEHQTALICFQRAAAAAPDYAYAYTLAGHEAHDLGLHDEAIAYFRSAIRCDRRHWNGWAGLGRVYLGIGDHESVANKCFQQAISLNPHNHILWDLVGWTFSLIGVPSKALESYDRAITLAPRASVLTYLRRAELLLQHGHTAASHKDLVTAHELAPEEASIHILLAQSYMRMGGGSFCSLENSSSSKASAGNKQTQMTTLRATGQTVLPTRYQAEISHHLSVAIDLDPSLLRVIKSITEGFKSLPGQNHPHGQLSNGLRRPPIHDLSLSSINQTDLSYSNAYHHHQQHQSQSMPYDDAEQSTSHIGYHQHAHMGMSSPHQQQRYQHQQQATLLAPADFASSTTGFLVDSSSGGSFFAAPSAGSSSGRMHGADTSGNLILEDSPIEA